MSPAPGQPQPDLSERALAQRERVLVAAEQCFMRRGFHAASIADIASAAEMSAGLIYRYFENKNAIVLAIIERQLAEGAALIDRLNAPGELVDLVVLAFEHWRRRDEHGMRAALFLEIAAEATRHEDIARTLQATDIAIRARLQEAVQRHARAAGSTPSPAGLRARTLLLQSLIEGLAVRAIRDPHLQPAEVRTALEQSLPRLLQ